MSDTGASGGLKPAPPADHGLSSLTAQAKSGDAEGLGVASTKKRKHRAGKKRRNRRQSFIPAPESVVTEDQEDNGRPSLLESSRSSAARLGFYRLKENATSTTSMDSDHLFDHRDYGRVRRRRSNSSNMHTKPTTLQHRHSHNQRSSVALPFQSSARYQDEDDETEEIEPDDRSPLLGQANNHNPAQHATSFYDTHGRRSSEGSRPRSTDFDVNNPPSVPTSPKMVGTLGDVMIPDDFEISRGDVLIDIDPPESRERYNDSSPHSPRDDGGHRRRKTLAAEDDVCFPGDVSELGEGEGRIDDTDKRSTRRRRRRQWPDLDVLHEWSREEKEERHTGNVRAKKITEPVMVGGRLRAAKQPWHREEDDAPYRYTYFNESFDATIHSRTISELCQFGASYKDLFNPVASELSDSSDDEGHDEMVSEARAPSILQTGSLRNKSSLGPLDSEGPSKTAHSPMAVDSPENAGSVAGTPPDKPKRYGPRPTFWLDVLRPTEQEMKILAKSFGIHQLTAEDIMMEEPREKVELFQNYYFVNYRSFEQDEHSHDYMEPINIYVVVFRDGVLSFHFSMTPHPANVRRRIRQLNDYMSPSADWISYAIIDDVTDAFAPLVQQIEEEVDDIDDAILALHSKHHEHADSKQKKTAKAKEKEYAASSKKNADAYSDTRSEKGGDKMTGDKGGDMLRHVGECRKKVMSLYRLLGNKADVIKGFAKRCNEYWEVAPRSEIGLYLGDIQDHIVTMTGNLSHYEKYHVSILRRLINIRMSERAESTNDVLGRLTVLGTIVLPMNIVTGMWGMNVLVPGQGVDSLVWFWAITAGLFIFGGMCFLVAKRVYRIV